MRVLMILVLLLFSISGFTKQPAVEKDKHLILELLDKQVAAWNTGDLEKFMETYWKSEKLVFVGSHGPTYGWQATLDNYKKSYPNKKAMGRLDFNILEISKIDKKTFFVIGQFFLKRKAGNINGVFTLNVQKIGGKFLIISDHSSAEN